MQQMKYTADQSTDRQQAEPEPQRQPTVAETVSVHQRQRHQASDDGGRSQEHRHTGACDGSRDSLMLDADAGPSCAAVKKLAAAPSGQACVSFVWLPNGTTAL